MCSDIVFISIKKMFHAIYLKSMSLLILFYQLFSNFGFEKTFFYHGKICKIPLAVYLETFLSSLHILMQKKKKK